MSISSDFLFYIVFLS